MGCELDFQRAAVEQSGGPGAVNLLHFFEPIQVEETLDRLYSSSMLACMAPKAISPDQRLQW